MVQKKENENELKLIKSIITNAVINTFLFIFLDILYLYSIKS